MISELEKNTLNCFKTPQYYKKKPEVFDALPEVD